MSDQVFKKLFQIMNSETALIMTLYSFDKDFLDDLYADFIEGIADDDYTGFINYLTLLIAYLETKENYEWCDRLHKLKNQIIKYDGEGRDNK